MCPSLSFQLGEDRPKGWKWVHEGEDQVHSLGYTLVKDMQDLVGQRSQV